VVGGSLPIQRVGERRYVFRVPRINSCHCGHRNRRVQFAATISVKWFDRATALGIVGRCLSRHATDHRTRVGNTETVVRNRPADGGAGNRQQVQLCDAASEYARQSNHGLLIGHRAGWFLSERYRNRRDERSRHRNSNDRVDRRFRLRLFVHDGSDLSYSRAHALYAYVSGTTDARNITGNKELALGWGRARTDLLFSLRARTSSLARPAWPTRYEPRTLRSGRATDITPLWACWRLAGAWSRPPSPWRPHLPILHPQGQVEWNSTRPVASESG
jgi:hypothetical protein